MGGKNTVSVLTLKGQIMRRPCFSYLFLKSSSSVLDYQMIVLPAPDICSWNQTDEASKSPPSLFPAVSF